MILPLTLSLFSSCGNTNPPEPNPEDRLDVTCTDGIEIVNPYAYKNQTYSTKLKINNAVFPETLSKVTVNESVLADTDYVYTKQSDTVATFSIDAQHVIGPIDISLDIGHKYNAILVVDDDTDITLSNNVVCTFYDYETEISFNEEKYPKKRISPELISVTSNGIKVDYEYKVDSDCKNKATLKINKSNLHQGNVIIKIKGLVDYYWFDYPDWWNYCSIQKEGVPIASENDIGRILKVEVNGQMHEVRLIGLNHDVLADGNGVAHCTFEFANLISDSNGHSLATPWNWKDKKSSTNHDFLNSNLRKAIDGEGNGELRWYERDFNTKSTTYTEPVLEMLPDALKSVLKTIKKPITLYNETESKYYINTDDYITQLFPLSVTEEGYETSRVLEGGDGEVYEYYKQEKKKNSNGFFAKHQVDYSEPFSHNPPIEDPDVDWSPTHNLAGDNKLTKDSAEWNGERWFRSSNIDEQDIVFRTNNEASVVDPPVHQEVVAVSPGFCI